MKNIVYSILALLTFLFSCNNKRTENNASSFVDDALNPTITKDTITEGCEGITLDISNSYIPSNLEVIMNNNSNYHATYGISWNLYFSESKEWVECVPDFGFVDIGRGMSPNQKDTLYIPLDQFKQPLESGEYKLMKEITLNYKKCMLIKYFKLEF